jgi:hypothetical protein
MHSPRGFDDTVDGLRYVLEWQVLQIKTSSWHVKQSGVSWSHALQVFVYLSHLNGEKQSI